MASIAAMHDTDIYMKTDAGRDEIRSRTLGLPMSIRAILLMVDGQRTVSSMRSIIAGSKAPADVLDSLVAQGLIAPASAVTAAPAPAVASQSEPPASTPAVPLGRRGAHPALPPSLHIPPASLKQKHNVSRITYDGPFDLTLPTIFGPENEPPAAMRSPDPVPEPPPVDRYEHLYGMMNEIVRDFLAPHRRYFFQLKIERAGTSEQLLELLNDLQTALTKARGAAFAADVISRIRNAAG
jgi:hypothetical protein